MKCPVCTTDLVEKKHRGVDVQSCPTCQGMWLNGQALVALEDEAFDVGDDEKGTLIFSATPTERKCPQCGKAMQRFHYRMYDLELEFCADGHGYWLDADEDKRVLALMEQEESDLKRSTRAEDRWAAHLRHMRSGSFFDRLRGLFR